MKKNHDSAELRRWLGLVPYSEYKAVKHELFVASKAPIHTFNNWISGNCRVPGAAKELLNQKATELKGRPIFASTGEN